MGPEETPPKNQTATPGAESSTAEALSERASDAMQAGEVPQTDNEKPQPDEQRAAEDAPPSVPKLLLEPASSGRAGCRACGDKIPKGQLRLGEILPNPYTETDTTYWFHLECAVYRRPEPLLSAIDVGTQQGTLSEDPLSPEMRTLAQNGVTHRRLARITRIELSPSGRARCRHCKEAIASESLRFALTIFQEGRFDPMGFVHHTCAVAYFGTAVELERALYHARQLPPEQQQLVRDTFA